MNGFAFQLAVLARNAFFQFVRLIGLMLRHSLFWLEGCIYCIECVGAKCLRLDGFKRDSLNEDRNCILGEVLANLRMQQRLKEVPMLCFV